MFDRCLIGSDRDGIKLRKKKRSGRFSQESADSIMGLKRRAGRRRGRLKSTRSTGLCLLTDFPMPGDSATCGNAGNTTPKKSTALRRGSLARTSVMQGLAEKKASGDWPDRGRDCFSRSYASSKKHNRLGWCLKTSRRCSIPMIAETCRRSSAPLPTAGIWDTGECLMLSISESPRNVVGFSWLRVLDATPHWSTWLMPHQWKQYLARLLRTRSYGPRVNGLAILASRPTRRRESVSVLKFSSLKRTHGIRWLSGRECLAYMGLTKGWMRSITQCDLQQVMQ